MSVRRLAEKHRRASSSRPRTRRGPSRDRQISPGRQASAVLALLWRAQKQKNTGCRSPRSKRSRRCSTCRKSACWRSRPSTRCSISPRSGNTTCSSAARPHACCAARGHQRRLRKRIGENGHVTADGLFSWNEVECLGACCNAPMVQINDDYYEDLTPGNFAKLLDDLAAGRPVKVGSQIGRVSSEPAGA